MGLAHGAYCVGCCWVLMLLLFVGGVMNLVWVAIIAIFVLAQKLMPGGQILGWLAGAALVLSGVVSILFGIVAFFFPGAGLVTIVWLLGIYALLFGVLLIVLSFRLRGAGTA